MLLCYWWNLNDIYDCLFSALVDAFVIKFWYLELLCKFPKGQFKVDTFKDLKLFISLIEMYSHSKVEWIQRD